MAPWNLHERTLSEDGKNVIMKNTETPLLFYHFSSYSYKKPEILSMYNRYSFHNRPDLINLYQDYFGDLIKNDCVYFSRFECSLNISRPPKATIKSSIKKSLSGFAKKLWRRI
jgi:hypothetical protein